ncbi:MAG: hypothetical protein ABIC04_06420 [Nanoarchaeota archaeon]
MDKKAIFMMHAGVWIFLAFVVGLVVMYLIAKKTIPIPLPVC